MMFWKNKLHLLQEHTSRYLQQLAGGMTLVLSATKPAAKAGADAEIEKITKTVHVRATPFSERPSFLCRPSQTLLGGLPVAACSHIIASGTYWGRKAHSVDNQYLVHAP